MRRGAGPLLKNRSIRLYYRPGGECATARMQGTRKTRTRVRPGAGKNEGWRYKNITGPRIAIITIFSSLTMHLGVR